MKMYLLTIFIGSMILGCGVVFPMEKNRQRDRRNTIVSEDKKQEDAKKGPMETLRNMTGLSKKKSKDNVFDEDSTVETKLSRPTPQVSLSIIRERKTSTDDLEEKKEKKMFDTLRVSDRYGELKDKKTAELTFKLVVLVLEAAELTQKECPAMYAIAKELQSLISIEKCRPLTEEETEELQLCIVALKFKKSKEKRSVTMSASPDFVQYKKN